MITKCNKEHRRLYMYVIELGAKKTSLILKIKLLENIMFKMCQSLNTQYSFI